MNQHHRIKHLKYFSKINTRILKAIHTNNLEIVPLFNALKKSLKKNENN
jgi:hypothetical protein